MVGGNIDNPLRHWVDNPHIPASAAKKAGNIYKKTFRTTNTSAHVPLKETLRSFFGSINQLAVKKNFIDAGEREDINAAIEKLCKAAGASSEEIQQAIVVGEKPSRTNAPTRLPSSLLEVEFRGQECNR